MGKELLQIYLRLLDADVAGASSGEISRTLFPEIDNSPPKFKGNKLCEILLETAKRISSNPEEILSEMGVEDFCFVCQCSSAQFKAYCLCECHKDLFDSDEEWEQHKKDMNSNVDNEQE